QGIAIAGKTFPVRWIQWREGDKLRTGLSDVGAMQTLGLELLDTNQPTIQPMQWFSGVTNLAAQYVAPDRYLDLTDWLQKHGLQTQIQGNNLQLSLTGSEILSIREGQQPWGKRIVLTLSRPAFWQVSQNPTEAVVTVNAIAGSALGIAGDKPLPEISNTDQDDLSSGQMVMRNKGQSFALFQKGASSKIQVTLPIPNKLQVTSLENPYRLVLDIRPDVLQPKKIAWAEGVIWRQDFINRFPVTWLELDLTSPKVKLKPLTSVPNTVIGSLPIATIVNNWQASAGINAGFFNRNTKFPLGAIKKDNRWLSGPILQRGAIAWNEKGEVAIARLSLQENLTTNQGQRLKVDYLNSGFVQKGLARYTSDWGSNYTPATNNEVITIVQNNQVISQQNGGLANQGSFPIPQNGYLLTIRGNIISPNLLTVGTSLTLESSTFPPDFNNYPQ
ncbi:MAG: phosphodiester glycosidase family protein, partial [Microcystaceae cyanobacterium]